MCAVASVASPGLSAHTSSSQAALRSPVPPATPGTTPQRLPRNPWPRLRLPQLVPVPWRRPIVTRRVHVRDRHRRNRISPQPPVIYIANLDGTGAHFTAGVPLFADVFIAIACQRAHGRVH